ncbi:holo-ACP synthase [Ureaplasma parvum]|uniref:Holo-[acyl-carrier-protein] synthase n=3 Tax=Ureaplasma parvum TaxID=134821 RepID=ACPS_UREPA|nr:holo-ACP synthase [Ureaplasma parvum]B1AJ32.1 RecName: Full=Holo-[acyl-carrier-protein] synthase; Short=Holo-ACP synthase; AltName: Full=4'-phosphopantetheinyl transferase AcpS [Ureaplasma parvum serovar 3 str. ATCC 27815]Q9PQ97.1 RecName: Full=Holo-[acyl-carrier-protein] synthase; Short=Holo-ACP synthase; AltName: Full=4'-phosphopantetheinyl transferase AcpS [Ureaplasma parvum serovar 3 str. ATCC 700970]pir/G82895/ holo-acyl carrier protein synthase UU393 [imported] - Ureaplasma urealyticum 
MKLVHGIDIIEWNREELNNPLFAKRILIDNELEYYFQLNSSREKKRYLASVFACKEAVMKALKLKYGYGDILILKTENQRQVYLNKILIKELELSISYTETYIVASVVGLINNMN